VPIVVSLFPKSRFDAAQIAFPKELSFRFPAAYSAEEIIDACQGADCLLAPGSVASINAEVLDNLKHIKLIQCPGAGFDHVDIATAAQIGIPVANVPGQNKTAVAELTIGLIIALQRQVIVADNEIKTGKYKGFRNQLLGQGIDEIGGSRVGLIGLGAIGYHTAKLLRMFGASVSYYSRSRKTAIEDELQLQYQSIEDLLATNDVISLHLPLTDKTRGFIGRRELGLLPPGALLINTARGEVINQIDLAEYLENGHLGGAALDTIYPEPPNPDHPLLNLSPAASKRLILTPHVAGVTRGAFRRMMSVAFDNMKRAALDEPINNVVNSVIK
jgi:phosphoglycerate dehydrogenase-like enzyme